MNYSRVLPRRAFGMYYPRNKLFGLEIPLSKYTPAIHIESNDSTRYILQK
jgi:hypothetical protein